MWLSRRFWRPDRFWAEDGISIVEVLAGLTLLAVVTVGAVPLFVSSLRTSLSAKFETQAKNIAQERIELMRNLPFHVTSSFSSPPSTCRDPARTNPNGVAGLECDYKDLLDTYYRSAAFVAASISTGGYVATNAGRSPDEISANLSAPFYRYVINPVPDFQSGRFSQVVVTQFMDAARNVVAPVAGYNSQDFNFDGPSAEMVGVTLFTKWTLDNRARKNILFTQMGEAAPPAAAPLMQAQATALKIRSGSDSAGAVEIQAEAGISRSDGSIATGASASTYAQGGFGAFVPGSRADGLYTTSSAPQGSSSTGGGAGQVNLMADSAGYTAVSLGGSNLANATADIIADQPSVPRVNPGPSKSTGSILRTSAATDLSFTNGADGTLLGLPQLSGVPISSKVSGAGDAVTGESYLKSQAGAGHFAEAGGQARHQTIELFPTASAPDGLVQVELVASSVICKSTGTSTAGTSHSFDLRIKIFNGSAYTSIAPITTVGSPLPSLSTSVGNGFTLANYIQSWNVASSANVNASPGGDLASVSLNGILHITTQNTRSGDDASAIRVDFGVLSCLAQDSRV